MNNNKQIKIGAVISYVGVFIGIVSGLIYNPWMIRTIGNSDYGLYTLAMSLINTFLVDLGLSMASERFISKYLADKDQEAVDNIIGLIFKLYLLISVILVAIFFALFFFIDYLYIQLKPAEMEKFKILYIMVAIYSITSFPFVTLNGILSSYEKFVQLKLCDIAYKLIALSLTIAALVMGYGVYALVVVNLITSVTVTIIRIVVIKRSTPVHPNLSYRSSQKIKELFGFSIWTSISTVASRLLLTLGPSVLGAVSGTIEIAIFGYAVSLESYIYVFVNAINGFFMPKLARISAESDETKSSSSVLRLMIKVGRFILILFCLIFVGFLVLGKQFIIMLVGETYIPAYYCTLLICAYGIIAYPQQIANTYTMVENKVKKRAIISVATIVLNLALSFPLGGLLGSVGVSISICIALFFQTVLMNRLYLNDLGIDIWSFFKKCHLKMLPGFLLFTVLAFLTSYIPINGWIGFAFKVMLIVIEYVVVGWLLILNLDEKGIVKRIKR